MEDKKTIIDKIKKMVFQDEAEPIAEDAIILDVKTEDGSILRIEGEALEEGVTIWMVNEDGLEAIPNGEFILEDGMKISTDADSKIASIEVASEEEVEEAEAETVEEMSEATDADRITKIEEALAAILEKFNKVETGIKEMTDKVQAISDEPAEEEIKIEKAGFKTAKQKRENAIDALSRFRKNK